MAIRIVTDSVSDFPPALAQANDITVIPCYVIIGSETYKDGVEITADRFYSRLPDLPRLPSTSQPTIADFQETYQRLLDQGHQIVSIHVSAKLSGTLNSAAQAKAALGDTSDIEIIDSQSASAPMALAVLDAARIARESPDFHEVVRQVRQSLMRHHGFVMVDTLEYLQKGGRIGKVRGLVGTLLKVRPIITVLDGVVQSATSVRSRSYGIQYMVTLAEERAPLKQAAVMHSSTDEEAEALAERIRPLVADGQVLQGRIGPVVGTHAGPGVIGIVVQSEKTPQAS